MTISDMLTAGVALITDLGVLPIIFVGAIIYVAVMVFRRFKQAAAGAENSSYGGVEYESHHDLVADVFGDDLSGMGD